MTETTKNAGEKLSVTSTKTLTLKRGGVEQGVVRQSFSHGRSKAVVVEKVKRRGPRGRQAGSDCPCRARRGAHSHHRHRQIASGRTGSRHSCPRTEAFRRR